MKHAFAAAFCAAMLTGCGQPAPQTETAPAGYPRPTASYVGTYQIGEGAQARTMTLYADGAKVRVEGPPPVEVKTAGVTIATVMDQATRKLVSFRTGPNAPKVAMTMALDRIGGAGAFFELDKAQTSAKAVGEDKIAGLSCRVWEIPAAESAAPAQQSCLTDDGIVLRSGPASAPAMLATDIKRGPQDAALFAPPAGYEIVDYSRCTDMAAEMMAAARAGTKPDMAQLQECQGLGQKVSQIFGG